MHYSGGFDVFLFDKLAQGFQRIISQVGLVVLEAALMPRPENISPLRSRFGCVYPQC